MLEFRPPENQISDIIPTSSKWLDPNSKEALCLLYNQQHSVHRALEVGARACPSQDTHWPTSWETAHAGFDSFLLLEIALS